MKRNAQEGVMNTRPFPFPIAAMTALCVFLFNAGCGSSGMAVSVYRTSAPSVEGRLVCVHDSVLVVDTSNVSWYPFDTRDAVKRAHYLRALEGAKLLPLREVESVGPPEHGSSGGSNLALFAAVGGLAGGGLAWADGRKNGTPKINPALWVCMGILQGCMLAILTDSFSPQLPVEGLTAADLDIDLLRSLCLFKRDIPAALERALQEARR